MKEAKRNFSSRGKAILGTEKPTGIADFLETSHSNTDVRKTVNTELQKNTEIRTEPPIVSTGKNAREEFRFSEEMAERLRRYAFDKRLKKVAVVTQALEELFTREGY